MAPPTRSPAGRPAAPLAPTRPSTRAQAGWTACLAALGALMAAGYWGAVPSRLVDARLLETAAFFAAAWVVLARCLHPSAFAVVIIVAALCRVPALAAPPTSSDVYRYIWDGRVQGAGINPYLYVPADPALAPLRDAAIYPRVSRREYARTIYPPVAQMIFFAVTRLTQTALGMKLAVVAFEAVAVAALRGVLLGLGRPPAQVLLYAWQLLAIQEYAGNGHIDPAAFAFIGIALLAHVRRADTLAGVALGCATLVKWYPALLLPALWRRGGRNVPLAMAAAMIAAYLPYLGAGSRLIGFVPGYAREEGLLSGDRFFLLTLARMAGLPLPAADYIALALGTLAVLGLRAFTDSERTAARDLQHAATLSAAFLVLFSPHYLWYLGWAALLVAAHPSLPVLYLTGASMYLFPLFWYRRILGIGGEIFWFNVALYGPAALLLIAPRAARAITGRAPAAAGGAPRPARERRGPQLPAGTPGR
jgi:alpha-1,6-mannosyltransferase